MEFFIIVISVIAVIAYGIIMVIAQSIQQAREERQIFSGTIDNTRLAFLEGIFELRAEELKLLRFDGFCFHVGRKLPYEKFRKIEFIRYRDVKIVNQKIPHSSGMISRQCELRLQGSWAKSYVTYIHPSGHPCHKERLVSALGKANEMLAYAEPVCLEDAYIRYRDYFETWQRDLASVQVAEEHMNEVRQVMAASNRLLSQGTTDPAILDKHHQLLAELNESQARMKSQQGRAMVSAEATTKILNDVRDQIREFRNIKSVNRDIEIVKRYQSS